MLSAGVIDNSAGGAFGFSDGTLSVGQFVGSLMQTGGTLAPGHSPGTTQITGDYTLQNGSVEIQLAGLAQGTEYDFVWVAGDLALVDGTLNVVLLDPFKLGPNEEFDIVQYDGTLTGTFAGLPENALVGTYDGQGLYITYAAGNGHGIALYTVPEPTTIGLLGLASLVLLRRRA
jgi:hypothetical protein